MVALIPAGNVATYGQIAKLAGIPKNSRQVGSVLRNHPASADVPWFRVVNSNGVISSRGKPDSESRQRTKLESEGVTFNEAGRVSLKKFGWNP